MKMKMLFLTKFCKNKRKYFLWEQQMKHSKIESVNFFKERREYLLLCVTQKL